jgi:ASCH domain
MKCVSVHQPWAWAIFHAGKGVENRSWRTKYRGPLLIHASKSRRSYDREAALYWPSRYGVDLPAWDELPAGAIVGIVDLVDCLPPAGLGPWAEGPVCWVFARPRTFAVPVPFRGAQLLFDVPGELIPSEVVGV